MSTSGFAAIRRRPSSLYAPAMRVFCSAGTRSHSRMMSGPWLAANAPTRLAIQPPDEFVVFHPGGEEVVAQQVRIGALGEERHIGPGDRILDRGIERIA